MKNDDLGQLWHIINIMSGRIKRQLQFAIKRVGQLLSEAELVESLNDYFVTVASDIPLLDFSSLQAFLPAAVPPPTLHPHELLKLRINKNMGPDNIPSRVLKKFAYEFSVRVNYINI